MITSNVSQEMIDHIQFIAAIFFAGGILGATIGAIVAAIQKDKTIDKLRARIAEIHRDYDQRKSQAAQKAAETRKARKSERNNMAEQANYYKELEKLQ